MKDYRSDSTNLLTTPYLDAEIQGLQNASNEESFYSKQQSSPFLARELYDESEFDDESKEILFNDEVYDELEIDDELDEGYIDFEDESLDFENEFEYETGLEFDSEYEDEFDEEFNNNELYYEDEFDNELIEYERKFNVRRAVRKNRYWARKLKWGKEKFKIKSFLTEMFPSISVKTEKGFAEAVEMWQRFTDQKKPDGIIGPKTWEQLKVHVINRTKTLDPSQIPSYGIDNRLKNPVELAEEIYQGKFDMLDAWDTGLNQFWIVMKSAPDAAVSTNFTQALRSFIKDSLLKTFAPKTPLSAGKYALGFFKAIDEEQARAKNARDSASLRDFMIRISNELREHKSKLRKIRVAFIHKVGEDYENMDKDQRVSYKEELGSYVSTLDKRRQNGWLSTSDTFEKIAFAWIRYSKVKNSAIKRGYHESYVKLEINMKAKGVLEIKGAKVIAPGGRQIAEQLIKNATNDNTRLKPYLWPVYRVIIFLIKNRVDIIYASIHISSKGSVHKIPIPNKGAHHLFKRLLTRKSTTMNVK